MVKLIIFLLLTYQCHAEWITIKVTHYDNGINGGGRYKCCGRWSRNNLTASGKTPSVGTTAAANFLPFGTRIYIEGIGWRTVQDRMSSRFSYRIDVFEASHRIALKKGINKRRVWIER